MDGGTRSRSTSSSRATSPLEEAHAVAEEVERAIVDALPEVDAVQTHLEPLAEAGEGTAASADEDAAARARAS